MWFGTRPGDGVDACEPLAHRQTGLMLVFPFELRGPLPVSAHCPTTTLLMSLADCLAHTQAHAHLHTNTETIGIVMNMAQEESGQRF